MVGATLLLLHAFPFDERMWDDFRDRLGEGGRAVVAPSLPVSPSRRTMEEWAEDVLGLVDGTFVPVGVSMGGYLAFELWRRVSERIPALVLADTRAAGETGVGRAGRERTITTIREGGAEALWQDLETRVLSPAASREVRERAHRLVRDRNVEELVSAVEAIRDRPDSEDTARTISVPALVVAGEEDAIVPLAEAAALANALPLGRLRAIPQCGHVPPLERPEAFAAVVSSFLEEMGA